MAQTGSKKPRNTGGSGRPAPRQSVAAMRNTKPGSNRTQVIIGVCAVVVIAAVIVVGLVINKRQSAAPVTDYGASKSSTSTVSAGVVTVTGPGAGAGTPTIDIYADALCPYCAALEQQYGQQIAKGVDEGKLVVRYHMLSFLDKGSASGTYSSRAAAALITVGGDSGAAKGAYLSYLTKLYSADTQPKEQGSSDLTNDQLADLAGKAGASAAAVADIKAGKNLSEATAENTAGQAQLVAAVGQQWGTPTVLKGGKPLNTNSTDWLTNVLAG